jgi:hypothetical protein
MNHCRLLSNYITNSDYRNFLYIYRAGRSDTFMKMFHVCNLRRPFENCEFMPVLYRITCFSYCIRMQSIQSHKSFPDEGLHHKRGNNRNNCFLVISTLKIENMWMRVKRKLCRQFGTSRALFQTYLSEFWWWNFHRNDDKFNALLCCILIHFQRINHG